MDSIIKPLAIVLGWFMDVIFNAMCAIGVSRIGIAIIILTVAVKVAMLPLTFSQQRSAKITQLMQPEIKAIRGKYRGRKDADSMEQQQAEIKAVYEKYGVSQTGGCIQLLIQMPILFALYNVFRNIPLYLGKVKAPLMDILDSVKSGGNFSDIMNNHQDVFGAVQWENTDNALTALNSFSAEKWQFLKELFPGSANIITENSAHLLRMNNFMGVNITVAPNEVWGIAILIPILAGVTQLISAKLSQAPQMDGQATKLGTTLTLLMMPAISVFIAFRVPAGLGIYWIATAVVQTVLQLIINHHYKNISADDIIKKSLEKKRKKLEKKGTNVSQETLIKGASIKTKKIGNEDKKYDDSFKSRVNFAGGTKAKAKNVKTSENKENDTSTSPPVATEKNKKKDTASQGSLAQKAGMVNKFNEKNQGKPKGKKKK